MEVEEVIQNDQNEDGNVNNNNEEGNAEPEDEVFFI